MRHPRRCSSCLAMFAKSELMGWDRGCRTLPLGSCGCGALPRRFFQLTHPCAKVPDMYIRKERKMRLLQGAPHISRFELVDGHGGGQLASKARGFFVEQEVDVHLLDEEVAENKLVRQGHVLHKCAPSICWLGRAQMLHIVKGRRATRANLRLHVVAFNCPLPMHLERMYCELLWR